MNVSGVPVVADLIDVRGSLSLHLYPFLTSFSYLKGHRLRDELLPLMEEPGNEAIGTEGGGGVFQGVDALPFLLHLLVGHTPLRNAGRTSPGNLDDQVESSLTRVIGHVGHREEECLRA